MAPFCKNYLFNALRHAFNKTYAAFLSDIVELSLAMAPQF